MSNKLWQTTGYIAAFSAISTLFIYIGQLIFTAWTALIVGLILLLACASVKLVFRRKTKHNIAAGLTISAVNAISTGLAVSTYYAVLNIEFGLFPALTCFGFNALWLTVYALVYDLFFSDSRILYVAMYAVWMILAIVGVVFLCVNTPRSYDAVGFQFIATGILSMVLMLDVLDFTDLVNKLSCFSYIVAIVIIIVVSIVLAVIGGDGCDGCDDCACCDGCDLGSPDMARSTYNKRNQVK